MSPLVVDVQRMSVSETLTKVLVGSGVSYNMTTGNIILSGWCFLIGPGRGSPVLIQVSLVFSSKEAPSPGG